MKFFVCATGDDMKVHEKIQIICKNINLWTINLVSGFLEFCTNICWIKVSLVKITMKSGSRGVQ
jgi:hypothetical protein